MFKTKENVINRKFKVFTLDLEFISLLRQDFFYIFFLIKPLLIHVSSYYMFTQPLILNSPLKVKKSCYIQICGNTSATIFHGGKRRIWTVACRCLFCPPFDVSGWFPWILVKMTSFKSDEILHTSRIPSAMIHWHQFSDHQNRVPNVFSFARNSIFHLFFNHLILLNDK